MKKLLILLLLISSHSFSQEQRALVNIETSEIIRYQSTNRPPSSPVKANWRKVVLLEKPTFDPATQRLERNIQVEPEQVVISWTVVALTQQEIDDRAAEQQARDDAEAERVSRRAQIEGAMADLLAGTANNATVQRILYEILKHNGFDAP